MKFLKGLCQVLLVLVALIGVLVLIGSVPMSETEERTHEGWLQDHPEHTPTGYVFKYGSND